MFLRHDFIKLNSYHKNISMLLHLKPFRHWLANTLCALEVQTGISLLLTGLTEVPRYSVHRTTSYVYIDFFQSEDPRLRGSEAKGSRVIHALAITKSHSFVFTSFHHSSYFNFSILPSNFIFEKQAFST